MSAPSKPTEGVTASGDEWRLIKESPSAPCMAVVAIITPETADRAIMELGRDERYELAWWNGSEWLESGTAHAFSERLYGGDGAGWMPTHWKPLTAPSPVGTEAEGRSAPKPSEPTPVRGLEPVAWRWKPDAKTMHEEGSGGWRLAGYKVSVGKGRGNFAVVESEPLYSASDVSALQGEVERLRKVLTKIATQKGISAVGIARQALGEQQ